MARRKIYPEEFLVRATVEERRLIDELAHKEKKSRSRFLVMTALTAQRNQGITANTFEAAEDGIDGLEKTAAHPGTYLESRKRYKFRQKIQA